MTKRMNLTDEEIALIEEHRRRGEVKRAIEKTIDWCHDWIIEHMGTVEGNPHLEQFASDMVRCGRDLLLVEARRKKS